MAAAGPFAPAVPFAPRLCPSVPLVQSCSKAESTLVKWGCSSPCAERREGAADWVFALRTGTCTWINNSDKYQEQNMGSRWLLAFTPMARLIAAV